MIKNLLFIDDFLKGAHRQWHASQIINFRAVLFISLFLRFQLFLIGDKLLFHQQPIFDALQFELAQFAAGAGGDGGQLGAESGISSTAKFLSYTRRRGRGLELLLFLLQREVGMNG